ncbi:MAG: HupE/UreJ family protein [Ectothiorhodospiraceae bacterium]|nr:HupE/UreJ family protein [Ectothiorhodospiraceae bacterium]
MRDGMRRFHTRTCASCLGFVLIPGAALAHHPMGGSIPDSTWHGLLSGFGHPIIGMQHLFFILSVALLVAVNPRRVGGLVAFGFIVATLFGAILHVLGVGLPLVDSVVAVSLIVAGAALALLRVLGTAALVTVVGISGLFHGHVYAESIIGATATPVVAYLMGFSLMHLLLVLGIAELGRRIYASRPVLTGNALRLTGSLTVLVGIGVGGLVFSGGSA